MDQITELLESLWILLNKPLIVWGESSITLWLIVLNIFYIFAFVFILSKLKNWLISGLSKKADVNISNWRAAITLSYYAVLVIGLISLLKSTGLDLSMFTVLTGAIGIGIGFGMQTIFSNFISGVIILLEKPLKLGDRIEVGDVSGNVQNISVRATTIITNDNVSIIVPNSDFISKQVINWSHSGRNVRTSVSVSVAYDSDADLIQKLLLEVAEKESGILKNPAPAVRLSEFGESGLKFSLMVWTQDYSDRIGAIKSLLNLAILKSFKLNKIKIPFPQREINLLNSTTSNSGNSSDSSTGNSSDNMSDNLSINLSSNSQRTEASPDLKLNQEKK